MNVGGAIVLDIEEVIMFFGLIDRKRERITDKS